MAKWLTARTGPASEPNTVDEGEELEVNDDLLIELFREKKLAEVQSMCRMLGLSDKGKKIECLQRMKDAVSDKKALNKVFARLSGCSGGVLLACCHHGVTYAIKFLLRGESPQDHVDIIINVNVSHACLI